ncbi:phage major tail protein, TP901-1 family [Bacillus glycinifermentans]|uniref:phage major tail protein, TP901-1 family n=1 Tax=Bacillus glycinifermentans TaxID=1664069 RepID=UPI000814E8EE|nr:phage major tail protein, TP901-1 family [Bacillus glycinifermentans]MBU8785670.1 phage major tail protein, TP901-1 family [Bacillus glycinifermentans]NUJ19569.1 phage major tail protein, TP901-1 family [Bacillus glycinifermentans]WKB78817.1 phage major tail protein, TP901-1 family [Bacillus glycinifermentans]SCA85373.1 Phage protein [Bacillus glycinifermentans]
MAVEYRGEEIIFAVVIDDGTGEKLVRPFNQTSGSTNTEADSIDLDTKDKTGSDYGKVTQSVSFEGVITEGDPFVKAMKKKIRNKEFVKIYEIDTRTKEAEVGMYMISSFEREFSNGDFATYSLEGSLNGEITEQTLTEIPTGAPSSDTSNPTPTTP